MIFMRRCLGLKLVQPGEQLALDAVFHFCLPEVRNESSDGNEFPVSQVAFTVNEFELKSVCGLLNEEVIGSPVVAREFVIYEEVRECFQLLNDGLLVLSGRVGEPRLEALADGSICIAYAFDDNTRADRGFHGPVELWKKCFEARDWRVADMFLPETVFVPIGV